MTSIEWLEKNIKLDMNPFELIECFNKAKEMHRSEIEEAFYCGNQIHGNWDADSSKYYQETYTKINLVEIPKEQLEKERNHNYKYFNIKPKP